MLKNYNTFAYDNTNERKKTHTSNTTNRFTPKSDRTFLPPKDASVRTLSLDLPEKLFSKLLRFAQRRNVSVKSLAIQFIREQLERDSHQPRKSNESNGRKNSNNPKPHQNTNKDVERTQETVENIFPVYVEEE